MLFIFHPLLPLCLSVGPDALWFHPLQAAPEAGRDLQPSQAAPAQDLSQLYFVRRQTKCFAAGATQRASGFSQVLLLHLSNRQSKIMRTIIKSCCLWQLTSLDAITTLLKQYNKKSIINVC